MFRREIVTEAYRVGIEWSEKEGFAGCGKQARREKVQLLPCI